MDQYSAITYSEAVGQISIELQYNKKVQSQFGCNCLCLVVKVLSDWLNIVN